MAAPAWLPVAPCPCPGLLPPHVLNWVGRHQVPPVAAAPSHGLPGQPHPAGFGAAGDDALRGRPGTGPGAQGAGARAPFERGCTRRPPSIPPNLPACLPACCRTHQQSGFAAVAKSPAHPPARLPCNLHGCPPMPWPSHGEQLAAHHHHGAAPSSPHPPPRAGRMHGRPPRPAGQVTVEGELSPSSKPRAWLAAVRQISLFDVGRPLADVALVPLMPGQAAVDPDAAPGASSTGPVCAAVLQQQQAEAGCRRPCCWAGRDGRQHLPGTTEVGLLPASRTAHRPRPLP